MGALAWVFKDYVHLQLLISIPPLITVVYYWIIPESVRWLIAKKRFNDAIHIIRKAAKTNGATISKETNEIFQKFENANEFEMNLLDDQNESLSIWNSIKLMLKKRIMWLRISIILYNFAINALVYFSLSLNSVSLSGNKFFNFILVSLIEIPGYFVGLQLINYYGRVPGFIASMVVCGITCIFCGYVETVWIQVLFFLIGKLGITSSFSIIYVHSAGSYDLSIFKHYFTLFMIYRDDANSYKIKYIGPFFDNESCRSTGRFCFNSKTFKTYFDLHDIISGVSICTNAFGNL